MDLEKLYSSTVRRTKKSVIRELLALTANPDVISFAGGLPDPALFPKEELKDTVDYVLENYGNLALQYGPTSGVDILKDEIIKLSAASNENISRENIVITTASQQGLNLVGKVFLDEGDTVVVGLPTYLGGLQAFEAHGAGFIGIDLDDEGMRVDLLEVEYEKLIAKGVHPKFVYVVPDFQNPSGVTLSYERRKQLLALAKKYEFFIVEDSPYRELRFEGEHVPSLLSMGEDGQVITLRTFSKTLIPGFRIGYAIGNADVIDKLSTMKQSVDLCSSPFNQHLIAEFCRRGFLEKHVKRINGIYKKKRDVMLDALEEYMPDDERISWSHPQGGLFLWLVLPEHFNMEEMFKKCIDEHNVAFIMGSAFCCDGSGKNKARMNFSFSSEEQIVEGVRRLSLFVKDHL